MLALVLAVIGVYWRRVTTASRPQRRALIAVAASSLLFLPLFFIYHFARLILHADPSTVEPLLWALLGSRVILPLGFSRRCSKPSCSPVRYAGGCSSNS